MELALPTDVLVIFSFLWQIKIYTLCSFFVLPYILCRMSINVFLSVCRCVVLSKINTELKIHSTSSALQGTINSDSFFCFGIAFVRSIYTQHLFFKRFCRAKWIFNRFSFNVAQRVPWCWCTFKLLSFSFQYESRHVL